MLGDFRNSLFKVEINVTRGRGFEEAVEFDVIDQKYQDKML
jgi:hypothetical protein